MAIVGKCVHCGWLVTAEGTYEARADERPQGAREHRCDDTACVVDSSVSVDAMARELRELSSDVRQHESLMRARWGRDYSDEIFEEAAAIVEHERAEG